MRFADELLSLTWAEAPAKRSHLEPATVTRRCRRRAADVAVYPTGACNPKVARPRRDAQQALSQMASDAFGVAWQPASQLLDGTRLDREVPAERRPSPKARLARSSRPEGRGDSPAGTRPDGEAHHCPAPVPTGGAHEARSPAGWPFVAFGRSTDARFGAAVRDVAARPVARFASARRLGRRVARSRPAEAGQRPGAIGVRRLPRQWVLTYRGLPGR